MQENVSFALIPSKVSTDTGWHSIHITSVDIDNDIVALTRGRADAFVTLSAVRELSAGAVIYSFQFKSDFSMPFAMPTASWLFF